MATPPRPLRLPKKPETIDEGKKDMPNVKTSGEILSGLQNLILGQSEALHTVVPYVVAHNAGLTTETRPVASILLLGPTGTGKTRTVEALAEVLHGPEGRIMRIDCGQFALQHEVAKLMGAPPGYLGHRETVPMITQKKLSDLTTEHCNISIVLFDELEKAHPSILQMLLSITDKAMFTLGDNSTVDFSNTIIFFTSNLGAREMYSTMTPEIGFADVPSPVAGLSKKLERVGMVAVRKKFSPEFINRLDEIITYAPLSKESIRAIFTLAVDKLRATIFKKFGGNAFLLVFAEDAAELLIAEGFSDRYGARELSRVIFRRVTRPLSEKITEEGIAAGAVVRLHLDLEGKLVLDTMDPEQLQKTLAKGNK